MDKEIERFEESLRDWAARPPGRTGAEAALAVRSAIRQRPKKRLVRWSGLAAAAAIVIAVSSGILRRPEAPPVVVGVVGEVASGGLADGVVLMWLDEETPLYMTFQGQGEHSAIRGVMP